MADSGEKTREALLALLHSYATQHPDEAEVLRRIETWLASADQPLDRTAYDPGHAVGSAFVVSDQRKVALIFHPKLHRWLQPGGHAERGETDLARIAARETREELGITVDAQTLSLFDVDVHTIPARDDAPEHLHFDFRFLGVVRPVGLKPGDDGMDARWFTDSEAREIAHDDTGLTRAFDKARSRRLLT